MIVTTKAHIIIDFISHKMISTKGNLYAIFSACIHYFEDLAKKRPKIDKDHTPVLLVHGYLHNSSAWVGLKGKLEDKNAGSVFAINLGPPFYSIEEYSRRIKAKAQEIKRLTGRSDLIIVGHSMGGLAGTYYALNHAEKESVRKVITLGSPLQGTYLGYIGIGKCARQMIYGSEFTKKLLRQMELSPYTKFVNLGSQNDSLIKPAQSATPLKSAHITTHEFEEMGHMAYLTSSKVHEVIINSILS